MKIKAYFFVFLCAFLLISCDNKTRTQIQNSNDEDEIVEVEEEIEEECQRCNGIGHFSSSCSSCYGYGNITHYSTGTRPKACPTCNGRGMILCKKCGAQGYIRCQYCNGRGSFQCTVCHGYGIIVIDPTRPHLSPKCNNCKGTGYEDCLTCNGYGRIKCCDDGLTHCPTCWGSGQYGQENYSESYKEECSSCNGSGRLNYECNECDGTGKVIVRRIVKKKKSEL